MKTLYFPFTDYGLLFVLFSSLCWIVTNCSSIPNPRFTTTPPPDNVQSGTVVSPTETSVTIQFDKVNDIGTYTLRYYTNRPMMEQITWNGTNPVKYTVSGLTAARTYPMTLYTVDNGVQSSGYSFIAITAPENVAELKAIHQTESSITLEWTNKEGIALYTLKYNDVEINFTAEELSEPAQYVVPNLNSGTHYDFKLFTVFNGVRSTGANLTAATFRCGVTGLKTLSQTETTITLQWNKMDDIQDYLLVIDGTKNESLSASSENLVTHTVTNRQSGTLTSFILYTVFANITRCGKSHIAATVPPKVSSVKVTERTDTKITLEWESARQDWTYLLNINNKTETVRPAGGSNIISHSVEPLKAGTVYDFRLTTEFETLKGVPYEDSTVTLPPMLTARCKNYASGYSIYIEWDKPNGIWNYAEINVSGKTYKVGENGEQFAELQNFQPAKKYQVSICSISGDQKSDAYVFTCATDARGVIAGTFFGVLLFVILIGVVVFLLLKRPDIMRQKMSLIGRSRTTVKKSKGIPVSQFLSHFNELSANGNRGFSREYEALYPVGTEQTQKDAVMQENKTKNRFVLPYDQCRVKLASSNSSDDYINASYMPGYNSDREYIAAQGPMPCTVNDFWRMIWEQKAKCIVMVTNCIEGGQTKCEQYWPADSKPQLCGDFTVSTISEQRESNKWTLREFQIKHKCSSEERIIKQLHFTAWPDHGVPLGSEVFIQFRKLVRGHRTEGTPTVVHGSAGVGRTGTFIALDVLLQQMEKDKVVDVKGFVQKMRLNRPHMVQTESQYAFLHQCIVDKLDEEHIYENPDPVYDNDTPLREFNN